MLSCFEHGANDLDMVQLMQLPLYHLLPHSNPVSFTFLLLAYHIVVGKANKQV